MKFLHNVAIQKPHHLFKGIKVTAPSICKRARHGRGRGRAAASAEPACLPGWLAGKPTERPRQKSGKRGFSCQQGAMLARPGRSSASVPKISPAGATILLTAVQKPQPRPLSRPRHIFHPRGPAAAPPPLDPHRAASASTLARIIPLPSTHAGLAPTLLAAATKGK